MTRRWPVSTLTRGWPIRSQAHVTLLGGSQDSLPCFRLLPCCLLRYLFCLLPLWMAVRSLVHARGNDDQFVTGRAVKISRPEVEALIADCVASVSDDRALVARFEELRDRPASLPFGTPMHVGAA